MSKQSFHKISEEDIRLGVPIAWDIYDAKEMLLVRKGFIPESEKHLQLLIQRGLYANEEEYLKAKEALNGSSATDKKPLSQILNIMGNAQGIVKEAIENLVSGNSTTPVDMEIVKAANVLEGAIAINTDIALAFTLFKQTAEGYVARHLMDAAILSLIVARSMKLPQDEVTAIVSAALTMNIGMFDLQEVLHNREMPPTDEEELAIKRHPEVAVTLLEAGGVKNPLWLSYVLYHHECEDGSGYPYGKSGDQIPLGAKIIAMADRYTAMVAPRKFRKGMHATHALRSMLIEGSKLGNAQLAAYFVKELGIYPPGVGVRLANEETAIVMRKGQTAMTPIVQSIKNSMGIALTLPHKRDTEIDRFAIKEPVYLEATDITFNMQQLWGGEAT